MPLVILGIGFGLMLGMGLYFLLLRPALKERKEAEQQPAIKEKQDP